MRPIYLPACHGIVSRMLELAVWGAALFAVYVVCAAATWREALAARTVYQVGRFGGEIAAGLSDPQRLAVRRFLAELAEGGGFLADADPKSDAWAEEVGLAASLGFVTGGPGFGLGVQITPKGRSHLAA